MGLLDRIIFPRRSGTADIAYQLAMGESGDLIRRMREDSNSKDAARAVMADVWAQSHNVPFMATVVEAVQEIKSGIEQRPEDQ